MRVYAKCMTGLEDVWITRRTRPSAWRIARGMPSPTMTRVDLWGAYGGRMASDRGFYCRIMSTDGELADSLFCLLSRPLSHVVPRRPRQDSNLRTRLRRPLLYPLSYGGSRTQQDYQDQRAPWPPRRAAGPSLEMLSREVAWTR